MHHLVGAHFRLPRRCRRPPSRRPCVARDWLVLAPGIGGLPSGSDRVQERRPGTRFGTSDLQVPEHGARSPLTTDTEGFGPEDGSLALSSTGLALTTLADSAAVLPSETTCTSDVCAGPLSFMLAADDACATWASPPGYDTNAMGGSVW